MGAINRKLVMALLILLLLMVLASVWSRPRNRSGLLCQQLEGRYAAESHSGRRQCNSIHSVEIVCRWHTPIVYAGGEHGSNIPVGYSGNQ